MYVALHQSHDFLTSRACRFASSEVGISGEYQRKSARVRVIQLAMRWRSRSSASNVGNPARSAEITTGASSRSWDPGSLSANAPALGAVVSSGWCARWHELDHVHEAVAGAVAELVLGRLDPRGRGWRPLPRSPHTLGSSASVIRRWPCVGRFACSRPASPSTGAAWEFAVHLAVERSVPRKVSRTGMSAASSAVMRPRKTVRRKRPEQQIPLLAFLQHTFRVLLPRLCSCLPHSGRSFILHAERAHDGAPRRRGCAVQVNAPACRSGRRRLNDVLARRRLAAGQITCVAHTAGGPFTQAMFWSDCIRRDAELRCPFGSRA